jgi:hypothetical protein
MNVSPFVPIQNTSKNWTQRIFSQVFHGMQRQEEAGTAAVDSKGYYICVPKKMHGRYQNVQQ